MPKKTKELYDLKLDEISLVDKGDDPEANVVIFKRKEDEDDGIMKKKKFKDALTKASESWLTVNKGKTDKDLPEILKASSFSDVLAEQETYQSIWELTDALSTSLRSIVEDDSVQDKQQAADESLNQFHMSVLSSLSLTKGKEKSIGGKTMATELEKLQKKLDDAVTKLDKAATDLATVTEENVTLKAAAEAAAKKADEDNTDDGIDKSALPEVVQKQMADQDAAIQKQADEISKMKDEKETEVFTKKATEYGNLPLKADTFAPILKSASAHMSKEEFEELDRVLKAANEIAGKVTKEFGSSETNEDGETAYDQLVTKGAEIASRDGLTKEQGFVKAKNEHPALWNQHREEQRNSH